MPFALREPDIDSLPDPMRDVWQRVRRLQGSPAPVLICGETGVGKEVIANYLMKGLKSQAKVLSAIPSTLLESELFGHTKGAFTGATENKKGLFERLNGGALFLDEIGELPLDVQPKLLRVLQERKFEPVGAPSSSISVNLRLVFATNRNLPRMVAEGKFRADLYWRIATHVVQVPPLRERREELNAIAERLHHTDDEWIKPLSAEAKEELLAHPYEWPGNIRELEMVLRRASLADGQNISRESLCSAIAEQQEMWGGTDLTTRRTDDPVASELNLDQAEVRLGEALMAILEPRSRDVMKTLRAMTPENPLFRPLLYALVQVGRAHQAEDGGSPRAIATFLGCSSLAKGNDAPPLQARLLWILDRCPHTRERA